jgi:hypothetical protein
MFTSTTVQRLRCRCAVALSSFCVANLTFARRCAVFVAVGRCWLTGVLTALLQGKLKDRFSYSDVKGFDFDDPNLVNANA